MNRAGREPAEDVKRRLAAACREVGLKVVSARMVLFHQHRPRLVHVSANVPGWSHEGPTLSLMTTVKMSGERPEFVDVRCAGTDEEPAHLTGPWMKGRDRVPFSKLIEELIETLREREQVVAAEKAGRKGPYRFAKTVWAKPDILEGLL